MCFGLVLLYFNLISPWPGESSLVRGYCDDNENNSRLIVL